MQYINFSLVAFALVCVAVQADTYPSRYEGWPTHVRVPREYPESDYYYSPKPLYYYSEPVKQIPDFYNRVPYPYYYEHFADEDAAREDERLASLPVGQETYYQSEPEPDWHSSDIDDVNAAFLDNLILTQMAHDAQRRREYAHTSQSLPTHSNDYDEKEQDEEVRELKSLVGKPMYHEPKTVPKYEEDDYNEDEFINWNGYKRSAPTAAPPAATMKPKEGQDEIMVPRPSTHQHQHHAQTEQDKKNSIYEKITKLLATGSHSGHEQESLKSRRIDKRFVSSDSDLVAELRGLKQRIRT